MFGAIPRTKHGRPHFAFELSLQATTLILWPTGVNECNSDFPTVEGVVLVWRQ
jgi:hypothetical protein